jgi:ABC-type transport system involved in multi-copper enzyme maturation permease subunit
MRNLWTILRRELAAYYESAIGYIFMIVFLILSVGLFITPFFTVLSADMRAFFTTLPIILCIFLPAVTMRLWAEERKQNTWEMLLTFPMRPHELVLGKFCASLVFFLGALAGTLTIPLMLAWLGKPDPGPIIGAYVGTILMGAFFLALGLFVSSLCQDQIVAFVITLLACFGIFLLGTGFIATYIDSAWPGLGTFLAEVIGMGKHYATFAQGLLVVGDALYFLIWTAVFLFLNGLFLEIRSRPAARRTFVGAVVLSLGIGLMVNWLLADQRLARFDLTQDKIYTLSAASIKILRSLPVPVQIRLYITPSEKMPTEMRNLERDIFDKLDEMRLASGGKLVSRAIHMEATNVIQAPGAPSEGGEGKEAAIEKRLLDKGVRPFSVQALREDEVVNKLVYASLGVAYKDKDEEILPRVLPDDLDTLEYRLINTIYKLSRNTQPVVALVAPKDALNIPPYMRQLYQQMGRPLPPSEDPYAPLERLLQVEKYDVRRVELSQSSSIPAEATTIIVLNPREFSERQRWELNRALYEGKSVFLGVQTYRWNYSVVRNAVSITKQDENPEVNPWLTHYGVTIDPAVLMDVNHQSLTIRSADNPLAAMLGSGVTLNLPLHIVLPQAAMNRDVSVTSHLAPLFYLWGSALQLQSEVLKQQKLMHTVLLSSSPQAWSMPGTAPLTPESVQPPASGRRQYPLAVLVRGQFPNVYTGKERPAWPQAPAAPGMPPPPTAEDPPAGEPQAAPGKLLVVGNAQMFHRNFLSSGNLDFFLNSIDALTLGDDIINVRSKKPIDRSISKPSVAARQLWKFVNLGLANLLIAVIGVGSAVLRRRARAAYTTAQAV